VGLARYLIGVTLAAIALVPVFGGCVALRRRVLTRWSGPPARLAEVVLVLGVLTGVSEILGTFGLFRLGPMVAALVVTGATVWFLAPRVRMNRGANAVEVSPPGSLPTAQLTASDPMGDAEGEPAIPSSAARVSVAAPVTAVIEDKPEAAVESNGLSDIGQVPPNRLGRGALVVALVATAVLSAEWGARTVAALHHGMDTIDTLWYHLPTAARFVQEGSITELHYFAAPDPVVAFYPANSALWHGLGMLFLDNDLLSPLLNLGFLAIALLAGWCIGRPFGVAPVALTGAAVFLATPGFVATQPGGAYNDVVGVALLLTSAALLVHADREGKPFGIAEVGVAALAAGLALGSKFTFLAPVAALSVGVIALAPRGERLRRGGAWALVVALAGGFWYVRNLVKVGNPLPGFSFGPLDLPSPPNSTGSSSVSRFLFDGQAWGDYFLPGLGKAYGPAWWALVALAAAGLLLAVLAGPRRIVRMLGLVGIAVLAAYLFSPQFLTLYGVPYYFVFNLRYASPALVVGLVLLPTVPLVTTGRRAWWVLSALAFVLVAIQLDPTVWSTDFFGLRFGAPIRGADSFAGAIVGVAVFVVGAVVLTARAQVVTWRPPVAAAAAGAVLLVLAGYALQRTYLDHRYAVGRGPVHVAAQPLPRLYQWARSVDDERIGIVGGFTILQYPLYGKDLSNHVQHVGTPGAHGTYDPIRDCADWRRALNAGRYTYVVTSGAAGRKGDPVEAVWTSTDPAAALVATKGPDVSVFRIKRDLDPDGCSQLPPGQRTVRKGQQGAGAGG
jgi:hypothetical protein